MTTANVLALARTLSYSGTNQVSDADMLVFLNLAYKSIASEISQTVREDNYSDRFTATLVPWQSEYTLPSAGAQMTSLSIDYHYGVSEWKLARQEKLSNLTRDRSWYEVNQPSFDPFFIIYDNSFLLFPKPNWDAWSATVSYAVDGVVSHSSKKYIAASANVGKTPWVDAEWTEVTNDVEMWAVKKAVDLTLSPSTTPIIPDDWHHVIALGMVPYVFKLRGMANEKNDAIAEFNQEKAKMIKALSERNLSPIIRTYPNTTQYE